MCHYGLGGKLGSNKTFLILRKMVPCDQRREQCSVTAKSPHHLSVPWFACISFCSQSVFLPRLIPPFHLCWSVMLQCILQLFTPVWGMWQTVLKVKISWHRRWLCTFSVSSGPCLLPGGSLCIRGADIYLHSCKKRKKTKQNQIFKAVWISCINYPIPASVRCHCKTEARQNLANLTCFLSSARWENCNTYHICLLSGVFHLLMSPIQ